MKKEHKAMMKARRRNIALQVAYDGTAYAGFQRQTPPIVAVQNVLEEKLETIFGDTIELAAAGRTDAGVHAYGQVVNFFTDGTIPTDRIPRAVNSLLPDDITVKAAWEADREFSARHSATSKTYLYRIQTGETPNPMTARYAWYIRRPLDVVAMQAALDRIVGTHGGDDRRGTRWASRLPHPWQRLPLSHGAKRHRHGRKRRPRHIDSRGLRAHPRLARPPAGECDRTGARALSARCAL